MRRSDATPLLMFVRDVGVKTQGVRSFGAEGAPQDDNALLLSVVGCGSVVGDDGGEAEGFHDRIVDRRTNFHDFVIFAGGIDPVG